MYEHLTYIVCMSVTPSAPQLKQSTYACALRPVRWFYSVFCSSAEIWITFVSCRCPGAAGAAQQYYIIPRAFMIERPYDIRTGRRWRARLDSTRKLCIIHFLCDDLPHAQTRCMQHTKYEEPRIIALLLVSLSFICRIFANKSYSPIGLRSSSLHMTRQSFLLQFQRSPRGA